MLTAALILTGLRVERDQLKQLFKGVFAMRESSAYEMILDEGRAEGLDRGRVLEARAIILRQGRKRFGSPAKRSTPLFKQCSGFERLERMTDRLNDAADWQDLLATP